MEAALIAVTRTASSRSEIIHTGNWVSELLRGQQHIAIKHTIQYNIKVVSIIEPCFKNKDGLESQK